MLDENLLRFFCVLFVFFWHYCKNRFELKMFLLIFKIHWNTWMKILYLKGYKWLLSQNQWVRIDFLGYIQYEALAKPIKLFLEKNMKVKGLQCPDYIISFILEQLSFILPQCSWKKIFKCFVIDFRSKRIDDISVNFISILPKWIYSLHEFFIKFVFLFNSFQYTFCYQGFSFSLISLIDSFIPSILINFLQ